MRALKKLGLGLGTIFGIVCAIVLVCAFNPEITDKIVQVMSMVGIEGQQSEDEEILSPVGALDHLGPYASLNPIVNKEPAIIEDGFVNMGITNVNEEEDR